MISVLVIDDAVYVRKQIKEYLEGTKFSVAGEGSSGLEVLDLYKRIRPQIVIMDIVMPTKGGIEATVDVMSIDRKAVVLLISSLDSELVAIKAIDAGAKLLLKKPFTKDELLRALNDLVS